MTLTTFEDTIIITPGFVTYRGICLSFEDAADTRLMDLLPLSSIATNPITNLNIARLVQLRDDLWEVYDTRIENVNQGWVYNSADRSYTRIADLTEQINEMVQAGGTDFAHCFGNNFLRWIGEKEVVAAWASFVASAVQYCQTVSHK